MFSHPFHPPRFGSATYVLYPAALAYIPDHTLKGIVIVGEVAVEFDIRYMPVIRRLVVRSLALDFLTAVIV